MSIYAILGIVLGAALLFFGGRYFFSPKPKDPCKKLRKQLNDAAKRYEKYRKLILDLINKRKKLKEDIENLKKKKAELQKEYDEAKADFDSDDVVGAGEWTPEREAERRRLKEKFTGLKKEIEKIDEEIKKKESEISDTEGKLKDAALLESIARENYPKLYKEYRDCRKKAGQIKEKKAKTAEKPCCPSGIWIGMVIREGGEVVVGGVEAGYGRVYCLDDPSVEARFKWQGLRVGPGLGGGFGAELIILKGKKNPCELRDDLESVMSGVGFDISVGLAFGDFVESLGKSGKLFKKVFEGADTFADYFKKLFEALRDNRELGKSIRDAIVSGGISGALGDFEGCTIPIPKGGLGVNVGLWWIVPLMCELTEWKGCKACD